MDELCVWKNQVSADLGKIKGMLLESLGRGREVGEEEEEEQEHE